LKAFGLGIYQTIRGTCDSLADTVKMGLPRSAKGRGKFAPQPPATAPLKKVFSVKGALFPKEPADKPAGKGGKGLATEKGYKGPRERVTGRVTGRVISWKGPFGFIQPDSPVDHPMGTRRGGKIYLDQIDVEKELSGVGAQVSFFVYCDADGLGAEHCIPGKGTVVQQTMKASGKGAGKLTKPVHVSDKLKPASKALVKPNVGLKPKPPVVKPPHAEDGGERKAASAPPDLASRETVLFDLSGVVKHWKGEVGWVKVDEDLDLPDAKGKAKKNEFYAHSTDVDGEMPLTNAKVTFNLYKDNNGHGCENIIVIEQGDGVKQTAEQSTKTSHPLKLKSKKGKGKDSKGKGKGKDAKEDRGPSGPDLPREVVSTETLTGEVMHFNKKMGWIKPSTSIEEAEKKGGKIYCHIQDVLGAEPLQKGQTVQFTLYKDSSGLGAQEILAL